MNESPPAFDENAAPVTPVPNPLKRALIFNEEDDSFCVEYDTTIGTKNTMRLEATTYEDAILEAKSFLGITENHDEAGTEWEFD